MHSTEFLKSMFDLDLSTNYTRDEYLKYLTLYKNLYREIYSHNNAINYENSKLKEEIERLTRLNIQLTDSTKKFGELNTKLTQKIVKKLSLKERIFGRIKY
jgi:hypothetical protein